MNLRTATEAPASSTAGSRPAPSDEQARVSAAAAHRSGRIAARGAPAVAALSADPDGEAIRLIFQLAGRHGAKGASPLSRPGIDWRHLLQVAWDEAAVGALRDHVGAVARGQLPVEVERQIACLAMERELRMRILERRVAESLGVLAGAGIDVALLKGAALAATVYGSYAARPMNDVDLLVPAEQAARAKQLLTEAGWGIDPEVEDEEVYRAHHHLAPLIDLRGSRSRLELHHDLVPLGHPFDLSVSDMWKKMRTIEVAGLRIGALEPNEHALHIAIHFAWSHLMRSGAWHAFRDIGSLERAGMLDWGRLVALAMRARGASCVYWTLKLAREMTGLRVPDRVLADLQPAMSARLLRLLEQHFVQVLLRRDEAQLSVRLDRALWSMAIRPRDQGHGEARPWMAFAPLTASRVRRDEATRAAGVPRNAERVARCSAYIARLLWS